MHRIVTDDKSRMGWSLRELAQANGVSVMTLRTEVSEGHLQASRIRRRLIVTRRAWEEYLERKRA